VASAGFPHFFLLFVLFIRRRNSTEAREVPGTFNYFDVSYCFKSKTSPNSPLWCCTDGAETLRRREKCPGRQTFKYFDVTYCFKSKTSPSLPPLISILPYVPRLRGATWPVGLRAFASRCMAIVKSRLFTMKNSPP